MEMYLLILQSDACVPILMNDYCQNFPSSSFIISLTSSFRPLPPLPLFQICPYPPGIPVIIKGEKITQAHLSSLAALRKNSLGSGCTITGCSDQTLLTIRVVQE